MQQHSMENKKAILVTAVLIFSMISSFVKMDFPPENNRPKVKIMSPENNSAFARNTMASYSIEVSDKEDGESKYQEIPSSEVFLEIRYVSDASKLPDLRKKALQKDPPGFPEIKRSDCFNCHAVKAKLIGPSFNDIGKRYEQNASNISKLADRIKKGSSGIWGDITMPPHPDISDADAKNIAGWILKYAVDPNVDYLRGTEGSFWFRPSAKTTEGVYMLTASYNDHGVDGEKGSSLKGQDIIIIKEKK